MSDEQPVGRPDERSGTDHTSWFPPFADRTDPDEGPRSGDGSEGRGADETQPLPPTPGVSRGDGTSILPAVTGADATRVTPATGQAARLGTGRPSADKPGADKPGADKPGADKPGADKWDLGRPPGGWPDAGRAEAAARAAAGQAGGRDGQGEDPVWSARAQVKPGRPGQGGHFTPTDWTPALAESRRPWWFPILIGIVVMLLLTLLGFGVWLIMRGLAADDAPGTPVPTPVIQQPAPEPTTEPTSASPTTTSASPSVALVTVPPVAGFSASEARRALDEAGLSYRLILRESVNVPAGTVIGSEPFEGREVPAGTEVTLMVAVAPTPSASSDSPTSTDDGQQPGDGQDSDDDGGPDED